MKNRIIIFFSVSLILVSVFCLAMFYKNKNTQTIAIYNSINGTQKSITVTSGSKYSDCLKENNIEGYEFEGFYHDKELTRKIDLTKQILPDSVVYEAYIQNLNADTQINPKAVGVYYTGNISKEKLAGLLTFKKVKIQTESQLDFDGLDGNVEELYISESDKVANINSLSKITKINFYNINQLENSFNDSLYLSDIENLDCRTIINSFCDCKSLNKIKLLPRIEKIENSFYKTDLETIESLSPKYQTKSGVLYEQNDDDFVAIKAEKNIISFSSDNRTSEIAPYAFYDCGKLQNVELAGRISKIGAHAFEKSSVKNVDISRNYTILTFGEESFCETPNLEAINFGNFIYKIEDKAFWKSGINKADFSNSEFLTQIGNYAFAYNSNLTEVKFSGSDNVITAKEGVFIDCKNLNKVENINFAQIENMLFYNCEKLQTLTGQKITGNIGNLAFYNCKTISDLQVLSRAQNIGKSAFENCESLSTVVFENIQNIDEYVFCNDINLTSVSFGNSVNNINFTAFENCENIETINFESANYSKQNNAIYSVDMKKLMYYMPNASATTFNIISSVDSVDARYLSKAKNLKELTSSNTIFVCEDGILYDVSQGKKLVCYPMAKEETEFVCPTNVTEIEKEAFVFCPKLKTIRIAQNVQTIHNGAMINMSALATLEIAFVGESTSKPQTWFLGWIFGARQYEENKKFVPTSLKSVTITNQSQYSEGLFYDCDSLISITINNINDIANFMFTGCTSLQRLILNDTIKSIGMYALTGCRSIIEIRIGYYEEISIDKTGLTNMSTTPTVYVFGMTDVPTQLAKYKEKFSKSTWTWRTV